VRADVLILGVYNKLVARRSFDRSVSGPIQLRTGDAMHIQSVARHPRTIAAIIVIVSTAAGARAQQPAPAAAPQTSRPPAVTSPEVSAERRVTFRIYAPQAQNVRLNGSDIPGNRQSPLVKADNGVWEVTLGPVPAGAYRYHFSVDGVPTMDPRNPATSESVTSTWSLVHVPGSDLMDTRNVPHGAVAEVTYYSTSLARFRRMHVYTPPGYDQGRGRYPVFYLLHGAGDSDDAWTTVGRAGFIMDNLIAAGKAKPMIVAMPAGHTSVERGPSSTSEFVKDFVTDLMPYVEKTYRVIPDRASRAIAGLSMGGDQSLRIAIANLEKFGAVGVYSSGLIEVFRSARGDAPATPPPGPSSPPSAWEEQHRGALTNAAAKKGLRLLWFGTGVDDFLLQTTKSTVAMLKKYGFDPIYKETAGGHTWLVWRDYLIEFVPLLFGNGTPAKS
jgi:enterochelin esterase family protein